MFNGDMGELMKQAKQMQEKLQEAHKEVAQMEVEGQSGAGLVKVFLNGKYDVKRINIDDSVLKEEKSVLEDLVAAAFNDGVRKLESVKGEKLKSLTGKLDIPDMKMPF